MEYIIPRPLQVVMDDVGWFNGKDDMEIGGPARTGINRYHCLADYQDIEQFGALLNMKINCAFILGEWDLENELPRKIPHFSHFGDSWDNARYRNPREMAEMAEFISSAEHIDVCLHGLYHGYYMPGVDRPHGSDYYYHKNGALIRTAESEIRLRIETFLELMHKHGIRKTVNSFVPPCFYYRPGDLTPILREYGIVYVTTPFSTMTPPAPEDTVFVDNDIITANRYNQPALRWCFVGPDLDTAVLPRGILGLHWPNILSMDPAHNAETVARTKGFFDRGAATFGLVLSPELSFCATQYLYEKYARTEAQGNSLTLDLAGVPSATGRRGSFVLSVKGRIAASQGADFEVFDTQAAFTNYRITPQAERITLTLL